MNKDDKETILKYILEASKDDLTEIQMLINYKKDLLQRNDPNRRLLRLFGG